MTMRLQYGTTAKVFHWTIVALLVVQYPVGWLMPDIHRGMQPGAGMTFHVSLGLIILFATVLRLIWRLTHPVAPESSLPTWQRLTSEVVHWMLYVMVLFTTMTGWLFASYRGWSLSFLYLFPLPMLSAENPAALKSSTGFTRPRNGRFSPWSRSTSPRRSSICCTTATAS
jgi:cytochrome b561